MPTKTSTATTNPATTISSEIIATFEYLWSFLMDLNEELPPVVFLMGSGQKAKSLKLGHYAHNAWSDADGEQQLPEVFIGTEAMQMGAEQVMCTLRHEAAHALAKVRDIKDVRADGRFHTKAFKKIAEEDMGLVIEEAPGIGWSVSSYSEETRAIDEPIIAYLEGFLKLHRKSFLTGEKKKPKNRNYVKCVCDCKRVIRMSPTEAEDGAPIVCSVCESAFEPEEA